MAIRAGIQMPPPIPNKPAASIISPKLFAHVKDKMA
jgi:hypothetical protein